MHVRYVRDHRLISWSVTLCVYITYLNQTVFTACPTEFHKIALAVGAPSPQTSLSLGSLWVMTQFSLTLLVTHIHKICCPDNESLVNHHLSYTVTMVFCYSSACI